MQHEESPSPFRFAARALEDKRSVKSRRPKSTRHGFASMRINAAMNLLGAATYSLGQWGILVVIAKWDGASAVGTYALGLAAAAPIVLFTNLNLAGVLATDARHDLTFGDYLSLRLMSTSLALATIAGVAGWMFSSGRLVAAVVLVVGLAKAVDAVADIFYGRCQQFERTWPVAAGMFTNGAVSLVAVVVATILTRNVIAAAIASAGGSSVAMLVAIYLTRRSQNDDPSRSESSRPRLVAANLVGLVKIALPLGVVMCLISLNANIPRYFIAQLLGPGTLGGFAVVASIQLLVVTVLSAVGQSFAPRMAKAFEAHRRSDFVKLLYQLLAIALALSSALLAISLIVGKQLLALLFRPEYTQYQGLLILLSAVTLVGSVSMCLGFAATAARSFVKQAPVYLATSIAIAVGCAVLIPRVGITGSAWAMFIGSAISTTGSFLIVFDRLRLIPPVTAAVPS